MTLTRLPPALGNGTEGVTGGDDFSESSDAGTAGWLRTTFTRPPRGGTGSADGFGNESCSSADGITMGETLINDRRAIDWLIFCGLSSFSSFEGGFASPNVDNAAGQSGLERALFLNGRNQPPPSKDKQ